MAQKVFKIPKSKILKLKYLKYKYLNWLVCIIRLKYVMCYYYFYIRSVV